MGDLVVKLNKVTKLLANFVVTQEDEKFLKAQCVSMGWIIPEGGFKFQPLNSPACLFHWRMLAEMLCLVHRERQEEWKGTGVVTRKQENQEVQSTEVVGRLPQPSPSPQPNPEIQPLVNSPCILSAIDSHMPIDRLGKKLYGNSYGEKIGELFKYISGNLAP